jgi:hypothetical protein
MDLFNKVEEITMISQLIMYNINLVPLAICVLLLPANIEQQGSSTKEKLQE